MMEYPDMRQHGKYVEGAAEVTKATAQTQTENGTATEATGTDISSWVSYENGEVNFTLKDAASYRAKAASKATPGFDVMDYGQETYEFVLRHRMRDTLTSMC